MKRSRVATKSSQPTRPQLTLVLLLMLSVLLSQWWIDSPGAQPHTPSRSSFDLVDFSRQTSWPLPPPSAEPMIGQRPLLPPSPPSGLSYLRYLEEPSDMADALEAVLVLRWRYVIDFHPDPVLRRELRSAWTRNDLGVSFNIHPSAESAAFRVTEGGAGEPTFPYIELNARELLMADSPEEYLEIMISVGHEWKHYQQWLDSSFLEREVFYDHPPALLSAEQFCRLWWEQEQDAMYVGCKYAIEWDMLSGSRATCRYSYTVTEFDHANFMLVLARGSRMTGPMQLCKAIWATQVGHPHPEEFQ